MKWLLPPVFAVFALVLIVMIRLFATTPIIMPYPYNYTGGLFILLGIAVAVSGGLVFLHTRATIWTFGNPHNLVITGPFRYTRNPMYLGMLLFLLGVAILANIYLALIFPAVFFLMANFWYIPFEETRLRQNLGEKYADYCRQTRRWI
jgi:protein-S-isoprenylcysteine O-methyltransferase Ste14